MSWLISKAQQRILDMQKEARALEEAGDLAAARERYEQALRRMLASDDDHVRTGILGMWCALAPVCAKLGDRVAAEQYYSDAIARVETWPDMLDELRASLHADLTTALAALRAT